MKKITGAWNAQDIRLGMVAGRFNDFIVESLTEGAVESFVRLGGQRDNITLVQVPGAFEIPLAVEKMAASGQYDGIVALGAVIRGGTPHFDYVAGECAKGLGQVMLKHGIPVAFGVLTVDTIEQAIERAGTKAGNKGEEALISVVETINVLRQL